MINRLGKIVTNPYLNLVVGAILLITAVSEMGDLFYEQILGFQITLPHGVILYAILLMLQSLCQLVDGLERVHHGAKDRPHEPS